MQFKMNSFIIIILSLAVAGASPMDLRVVGGSDAQEGQFPHMVSIRYVDPFMGDIHMCGGTILNSRWIVTAAHCVVGYKPDKFYIKAGTISLTKGGTIHQLEDIIPHKDFEGLNITNDIALIRLQTDLTFTKTIHPLPLNTKPLTGGEEVIFGGWGSTELWGPPPDTLQWLKAKVVPQDVCRKAQQPFVVNEGMICTFAGKDHGACHGDSGSFLMAGGKLVGVVSWGRPCAIGLPDVFTRISFFVEWIHAQMQNW